MKKQNKTNLNFTACPVAKQAKNNSFAACEELLWVVETQLWILDVSNENTTREKSTALLMYSFLMMI